MEETGVLENRALLSSLLPRFEPGPNRRLTTWTGFKNEPNLAQIRQWGVGALRSQASNQRRPSVQARAGSETRAQQGNWGSRTSMQACSPGGLFRSAGNRGDLRSRGRAFRENREVGGSENFEKVNHGLSFIITVGEHRERMKAQFCLALTNKAFVAERARTLR
jgi:hypothetical protein